MASRGVGAQECDCKPICGFDHHSGKWNTTALSSTSTQYAMPPGFGAKGGTDCIRH